MSTTTAPDTSLDGASATTRPGVGIGPRRLSPTPRPAIQPGALIDGVFRVIGTLGWGGMGVVLRARDLRLDREVAIKLIRAEKLDDLEHRRLFMTEARAMAAVRNPNVVAIHSLGQIDGAPYIVMEYVPGVDLRSLLVERRVPLALDEAIGILDQICQGVSAIHAAGAVHRDLKPENILLGPAMRVVVADFGVAISGGASEQFHELAGSLGYMPPEQLLGKASKTEQARLGDVYALGVLAYEMLTGRLPHLTTNVLTWRFDTIHRDPSPVSRLRPDLPAALDGVLARALARDPRERYQSPKELRDALFSLRTSLRTQYVSSSVLVVDDDEMSRSYLADVLRAALPGAQVTEIASGREAVERAYHLQPQLAVVDLRMPDMNGLEVVAALRAARRTKETKVIVVSGHGSASDWRVLQHLGAAGFLLKPVDAQALSVLARSALAFAAGADED